MESDYIMSPSPSLTMQSNHNLTPHLRSFFMAVRFDQINCGCNLNAEKASLCFTPLIYALIVEQQ